MSQASIEATETTATRVMRTLQRITWILLSTSLMVEFASGKEKLYIGTFYGVNVSSKGWSSQGVMPAVQMALDHVNRDPSILPGYELYEDSRDSKVTMEICPKDLINCQ